MKHIRLKTLLLFTVLLIILSSSIASLCADEMVEKGYQLSQRSDQSDRGFTSSVAQLKNGFT